MLFLLLGAVFGTGFALLVPPLQIPDEGAHFFRSFSISNGSCLPPASQTLPVTVKQLETDFPAKVERLRPVRYQEYTQLRETRWSDGARVPVLNLTADVYSCVPYLPSATGLAIGKLFSQSSLLLMYTGRLANLAVYLALIFLALRILPVGRPVLFCLALMPMSLHQAASFSADSMTIAGSFLFLAYVLYLACDPRVVSLSTLHRVTLGALLVFITLCKFNPWFILMLLLIPASKFGSTRRKLLESAAALVLIVVVSFLWQNAVSSNLQLLARAKVDLGVDVHANAQFLLHQPLEFLTNVMRSWKNLGGLYIEEFVGSMGWMSIALPERAVWWYVEFLVLLALVSQSSVKITAGNRLVLAGIVVGSVISVFAALWILEGRRNYLANEVMLLHRGMVAGIQGRYFIPFAPAFFLLLANGRVRVKSSLIVAASVVMVLYGGTVALATVRSAFYYGGDDIPVTGDWNGDGKRKIGIYRHGIWILDWDGDRQFTKDDRRLTLGNPGDSPIVGNWNRPGSTEIGVFQGGAWRVSLTGPTDQPFARNCGKLGDQPILGDFDGDGKTDFGFWRPSSGIWYYEPSSNPGNPITRQFGLSGDIPIPLDFDGDHKTDLAVYRPSNGVWYIKLSTTDAQVEKQFGLPGDIPVAADYDGDGKADIAVWRPAEGTWHIVNSSNPATPTAVQFGLRGDQPITGDFDGDGKTDQAVWRALTGTWYIQASASPGKPYAVPWNVPNETPIYP